MLENIIPSRTRRKILELFFSSFGQSFYLRKVVREVNEEVNAVKRELDILVEEKLLLKEKRLNKIFFSLNKNYLFFEEFLRIFAKLNYLSQAILKNQMRLGKIRFAVLSTKFVKKIPIKDDEVYLLLVGVIVLPEIELIIKEAEKTFGYSINYTVMTEEEFVFRKKNNDPFIWRFLKQPKVMIIGDEENLMR